VAEDEDNTSDTVVDAQGRAHKRRLVREKLERLGWIFATVALVSFGDGSNNLVTTVFHRSKASRLWFLLTAISMAGAYPMHSFPFQLNLSFSVHCITQLNS